MQAEFYRFGLILETGVWQILDRVYDVICGQPLTLIHPTTRPQMLPRRVTLGPSCRGRSRDGLMAASRVSVMIKSVSPHFKLHNTMSLVSRTYFASADRHII